MGLNEWLALLGALGGGSTLTWAITFWFYRKTNARKEDATADSMEDENERKQVAWLEDRISQRDTKIDSLYVELRQEQSEKLDWIHKNHELELRNTELMYRKCDVRGCTNREPPSDF